MAKKRKVGDEKALTEKVWVVSAGKRATLIDSIWAPDAMEGARKRALALNDKAKRLRWSYGPCRLYRRGETVED
jgi:hypothetical protein